MIIKERVYIEKLKLKDLGNYGENIAVQFLEKSNYEIIERNFLCKQGEIDIIAKRKHEIVFIEVKTRTNKKYGKPREAVNFVKKEHIWNSAKYYLYINDLFYEYIRFDVIEVCLDNNKVCVNHLKNIM